MNEVYAALAKVQAELPGLKKSAENPHFRSKYIPLEEIVAASDPLFEKHGLLFYSAPTVLDDDVSAGLEFRLIHLDPFDMIQGVMPLILDKQNSQGVGSAITYARRYVLTSLLNIIADVDDDGNKASTPAKAPKAAPEAPKGFVEQVQDTGKKAAQIREWAGKQGYTLDDVGVDAPGLRKFLNGLDEEKRAKLLAWAK